MNRQISNKYWLMLLGVIGLSWLLYGCERLPALRAEIAPTIEPTPTLSGILQVGELQEISSPADALQGWRIGDMVLNGHILIGHTPKAINGLVTFNLQTYQVTGITQPLNISDQYVPALTLEDYYAWLEPVYIEGKYSRREVRVINLYSGEIQSINGEGWVSVSGSNVVYARNNGHPNAWDLYTENLESGEVKSIAVRENVQSMPKINGDWVTYLDTERIGSNNKRERVRAYNLNTGEDRLLGVTQYATQSEGGTYGIGSGRIVWLGWRGELEPDTHNLHVFDTHTGEIYTPANLSADDMAPTFDMAGDMLFFGCTTGYCGYDLAQEQLVEIPYPHQSMGLIYVSQEYVVFRVEESEPNIIEILQTPGASTPTPLPPDATPPPTSWRLFIVPITRQ